MISIGCLGTEQEPSNRESDCKQDDDGSPVKQSPQWQRERRSFYKDRGRFDWAAFDPAPRSRREASAGLLQFPDKPSAQIQAVPER